MSSKAKSSCQIYGDHIQLAICTLIALTLAAVMLWGLVPVSDPQATLLQFKLKGDGDQTVFLDIEVSNSNYFRGFNYTGEGYYDVYYVSPLLKRYNYYQYQPKEYQGFRKTLRWNVTINVSIPTYYVNLLKTGESHYYVILYFTYKYKILFWTTQTTYCQWLDTEIHFANGLLDYKVVSPFNRVKNFTFALG